MLDDELDREAISVLERNRREGEARVPAQVFDFTCPSSSSYPFQWNWDSAFHAIALSLHNPARAQAEISTLIAALRPDGFLPHMVLWQEDLRARAAAEFTITIDGAGWATTTTQPFVLPTAVERVWQACGDDAWLDHVLRALVAIARWWRERRVVDDSGLVVILRPDESGLDSSPKYDAALGLAGAPADIGERWHAAVRALFHPSTPPAFIRQDVMVNAIHGHSCRALARLLRARGRSVEAQEWDECADGITAALVQRCWDAERGVFDDLHLDSAGTPSRVPVLTTSSLFPLILSDLPAHIAARLVQALTNPQTFWLPFPVPSVAANEPAFDPDFATGAIFRGSSWVNLNWYLHLGLHTHGYRDIADDLARRTRAMVSISGLRECYSPIDAGGHGAQGFSWSSLVLDLVPNSCSQRIKDN